MADMDELIESLRTPTRLIRVFVGGGHDVFHVQQQALETISPYFTNALKHDRFKEGKDGVLELPEDEVDVWKVLLHLVLCRKLPSSLVTKDCMLTKENVLLAVRCWTMGDKYGIKEFQDTVMLRLLRYLNIMQCTQPGTILDVQITLTVFERTLRQSPLRMLVTDWTVMTMYGIKTTYMFAGSKSQYPVTQPAKSVLASLETLDGTGFFPALTTQLAEYGHHGAQAFSWRTNPYSGDDPLWEAAYFLAFDEAAAYNPSTID
ncbi:hypothetical protein TI39_contig348g00012 [Zymoseptoria brevis]|uniref:BTB domain-containing protein n=1 Tax=Zymoseptoria brevis TaxID=1047168 RepID=A0A0F4GR62_9PEZI|nr:hypothetical protein TI39_contig348g00012 [Zymoseptoria brevis]